MLKEIGSEFWNDGPLRRNKVYLLSGRTALEYIIKDILKHYDIKSVLLPSYCCHTMIEPFCRYDIMIRFYDVYFDETNGLSVEIPKINENEIFYFLTYFGFDVLSGVNLSYIQKKCAVMIEDKTHSWLTKNHICDADYSYVSYRKWTGFDGIALACKKNGFFSEFPQDENRKYSNIRKKAFSKKRSFIDFGVGEKQYFLDLFNEAEELLEIDYSGYKPSAETMASFLQLDTEYIAKKRKENGEVLINGLKDVSDIKLIFQSVDKNIPLFIPILIQEDRAELRQYLVENRIYCPIHWPKSTHHKGISRRAERLYRQELSLICDQRYSTDDMNRIVECIRDFYKS